MTSNSASPPLLIHGAIITPHSLHCANYFPRALIHVEGGIIKSIDQEVHDGTPLKALLESRGLQHVNIRRLKRGEFLLPGFIDTHTHAPQFPIMGRGGEDILLNWLNNTVFPAESKFKDKQYADKVYTSAVRRLIDFGTTTCCYFSSSHCVGTKALVDVVHASGQRAFIGNCNMDRGEGTDKELGLLDLSAEESLAKSREILSYIRTLNSPFIRPILSPRFVLSCSDELLEGLGRLAVDGTHSSDSHHSQHHHPRLAIETHIAENLVEVHQVAERFPARSYTAVYNEFGLLGPTTILGHGCYLSPDEITLIKQRNAGISHCPVSNFYLTSGVAKVGEWLDAGVKVGLGTDVSGGFSPSMIEAVRNASIASKVIAIQAAVRADEEEKKSSTSTHSTKDQSGSVNVASKSFADKPLPLSALLYIATIGGAQLCNLEKSTGSLEAGKAFDALLVNIRPESGNPSIWWEDDTHDKAVSDACKELEVSLERFFLGGDDRNVSAVWVQGNLIGGREFHGPPV